VTVWNRGWSLPIEYNLLQSLHFTFLSPTVSKKLPNGVRVWHYINTLTLPSVNKGECIYNVEERNNAVNNRLTQQCNQLCVALYALMWYRPGRPRPDPDQGTRWDCPDGGPYSYADAPTECRLSQVPTLQSEDYDQSWPVSVNGLKVTDECQQLNANNPASIYVCFRSFSIETTHDSENETLGTPLYRNWKQTESAFSISFDAETKNRNRISVGLYLAIRDVYVYTWTDLLFLLLPFIFVKQECAIIAMVKHRMVLMQLESVLVLYRRTSQGGCPPDSGKTIISRLYDSVSFHQRRYQRVYNKQWRM